MGGLPSPAEDAVIVVAALILAVAIIAFGFLLHDAIGSAADRLAPIVYRLVKHAESETHADPKKRPRAQRRQG